MRPLVTKHMSKKCPVEQPASVYHLSRARRSIPRVTLMPSEISHKADFRALPLFAVCGLQEHQRGGQA